MVKNVVTPFTVRNNTHDFPVFGTPDQRERERLRQLEVIGCRSVAIPGAVRDELDRYFQGKKKLLASSKEQEEVTRRLKRAWLPFNRATGFYVENKR
jgi:hypothetical protein